MFHSSLNAQQAAGQHVLEAITYLDRAQISMKSLLLLVDKDEAKALRMRLESVRRISEALLDTYETPTRQAFSAEPESPK